MKVADLFPYQIKNRELFYHRNHEAVPFLDRNKYWDDILLKSVEGWWVNDEGTWVMMMPTLFWETNVFIASLTNQENKKRYTGRIDLTDREFIFNSYFLCCLGFSGLSDDEFFTSHRVVKKVEQSVPLEPAEQAVIDNDRTIYDKHGKMKKYVGAWDYLTNFYLTKEIQGKPLGKILYHNEMLDILVFGCRNSGKTLAIVSFLSHHLFTGGIQSWDDIGLLNEKNRYAVGSIDSKKVSDFMAMLEFFYDEFPGSYERNGRNYNSTLHRKMQGWGTNLVTQEYKDKETKSRKGSKSEIDVGVYTKHNASVFVGGRRTMIIREEFGLFEEPQSIFGAEEESLKDKYAGVKFGLGVNLGTSGFLSKVQGVQDVFYGPWANGIYGIPNYWEKPDSDIGLFMPDYYVSKHYKDDQGNTKIKEAYDASTGIIKKLIEAHAKPQIIRDKELNSPNWPSQMFLDSQASILCSDLARIRRTRLLETGYHRWIGDLYRDEKGVVKFKDNPRGFVLDAYTPKTSTVTKENSWSIYEMPIKAAPKGLYMIGYDTVRSDGYGRTDDASLVSIIIWKRFDFTSRGKQNTIVARWTGRRKTLAKNHEECIMGAEFYGCQVLHEEDVGDFTAHCRTNKKWKYMAPSPYLGPKLIVPGNAVYNVGIKMADNDELKPTALTYFNEHLENEIGYDMEFEAPIRGIDQIDDLMLLDEIAKFNSTGNFDNISACLLIMLMNKADEQSPQNKDPKTKELKNSRAREMYELAHANMGYSKEYDYSKRLRL